MANPELVAFFRSENWRDGMDLNAVMYEFEKNGWSKEDVLEAYEHVKMMNAGSPTFTSGEQPEILNNTVAAGQVPALNKVLLSPIRITLIITFILTTLTVSGVFIYTRSHTKQVGPAPERMSRLDVTDAQGTDNRPSATNTELEKATHTNPDSNSTNETQANTPTTLQNDRKSAPMIEDRKEETLRAPRNDITSDQIPCGEFAKHLSDCSPYRCSIQGLTSKIDKEVKGFRFDDFKNSNYCETFEGVAVPPNYVLVCKHYDNAFRTEMARYYEQNPQGSAVNISVNINSGDTSDTATLDMGETINKAIEKGVCEVTSRSNYELNAPDLRLAKMVREVLLEETTTLSDANLSTLPSFEEAVSMFGANACGAVSQSEKQSCQKQFDCLLDTILRLRDHATKEELRALSITFVRTASQPSQMAGISNMLDELGTVYATWGQEFHNAQSVCKE